MHGVTGARERSPFAPADNPAVVAHINLLQGIITRLATASGSCKTWCLTLVAALLGLAGASHAPGVVAMVIVPVVVFWFLDVMYLATEVAYRRLYNGLVDAIHDGTYSRENLFRAGARPTSDDLFWALGSWSEVPYFALAVCYATAEINCWPAMLAK